MDPSDSPDLGITRLLTAGQVADVLQVHRSSVYRLIESGMLRAVCFGKLRRVRQVDLDEFIEMHLSAELERNRVESGT